MVLMFQKWVDFLDGHSSLSRGRYDNVVQTMLRRAIALMLVKGELNSNVAQARSSNQYLFLAVEKSS